MKSPFISIVIPVFNEEGSLGTLHEEIRDVCERTDWKHEIIFVNDGSTDWSTLAIDTIARGDTQHVRAIHFNANRGKALALRAGFEAARGEIIITLDADLQDDPREIPKLVSKLTLGYDLVSGWKQHRQDSFVKNQTSKIYNGVTSLASGVSLHDHNCGMKAYRKEVAQAIPLSGELHRYIPLLAGAQGCTRITEVSIRHRARTTGVTKYGPSRFWYGITGLAQALSLAADIKDSRLELDKAPLYAFAQS